MILSLLVLTLWLAAIGVLIAQWRDDRADWRAAKLERVALNRALTWLREDQERMQRASTI